MAYDITLTAAFSGRPAYRIWLYVRRNATSDNYSQYYWEFRAQRTGAGTAWSANSYQWIVNVGGTLHYGSSAPDFRNTADILLGSGYTEWFQHDSSGNLSLLVGAQWNLSAELFGFAQIADTYFVTDRIAQVPPPPSNNWGAGNPDQIGPTSMRYRFQSTGDGGSPVLEWQAQRATDAGFTQNVVTVSSSGTTTFTGLTPGTRYYFRGRGRNAVGWGGWGSLVNAVTLVITPPTMSVTPSPTGTTATITVFPPSSLPNPSGYQVQRRVTGTGGAVETFTSTVSPWTVPASPGVTYEWAAAVASGGALSAYGPVVIATQPNPSTNAGSYFDGSSAPRTDVSFGWVGAAHLSRSTATGPSPLGWIYETTGPTMVLQRVTGGRSQAFAAQVTVWADGPGTAGALTAGTGPSGDVAEGGTYWASLYVRLPERGQRLAPVLRWYTAGGTVIGSPIIGEAVLVASGGWVRLEVSGVAPAGADTAGICVRDVAGDGWAAWHGGDVIQLDDAMLIVGSQYPYFDGNSSAPGFFYEWQGAENASPSSRTSIIEPVADPFDDPDCPPLPTPPAPPVILDDCVIDVGSWRRYWVTIPPDLITDWIGVIPNVTLRTGAAEARQVRVRLYANPDELAPETFPAAEGWEAEQVVSYLPPDATLILDGVSERVRASADGGVSWSAQDRLLYRSDGAPATWPVMRCGTGYLLSFDVPLDAPVGNLGIDVSLTRRY